MGGTTMNLRKIFPISYKKSFIASVIIYITEAIIAGWAIALADLLISDEIFFGQIVSAVLGISGLLVELYVFAGIIVSLLLALKILK